MDAAPPPSDDRPRTGALGRLLAAFTSPAEVFQDIARRPTVLVPLVALALVSAGAQLAVAPRIDMETTIRDAMEARGQDVTDEQIEKAVEGAESFRYAGPVVNAVIVPALVAFGAVILFLGVKIAGSDVRYPVILSATAHAWWPPALVASGLTALVAQRHTRLTGPEVENLVKSDLGALLAEDAPRWVEALAGAVDVFNLWALALLVVGLAATARLRVGKAAAVVASVWGLWLVVKVGVAAVFGGAS